MKAADSPNWNFQQREYVRDLYHDILRNPNATPDEKFIAMCELGASYILTRIFVHLYNDEPVSRAQTMALFTISSLRELAREEESERGGKRVCLTSIQ